MPFDPLRPVAVVDDDDLQRDLIAAMLADQGLKPYPVIGPIQSVPRLVTRILRYAGSAICDHRLNDHAFARFSGAEATAALVERGIPAILLTQFLSIDNDVSVRLWREHIPVALRRDQAPDGSVLVAALERAGHELDNPDALRRTTQRCLLRVRAVTTEGHNKVLDVSIAGWKPDVAVRLPLALLPTPLRRDVEKGALFVAEVNTDAEDQAELFFRNFAKAPPSAGLLRSSTPRSR
jgi:hypothetical protein